MEKILVSMCIWIVCLALFEMSSKAWQIVKLVAFGVRLYFWTVRYFGISAGFRILKALGTDIHTKIEE